jgi:hypothetical protein
MRTRTFAAALILSLPLVAFAEGPPGRGSAGAPVHLDLPEVHARPGGHISVPVRIFAVEPVSMAAFSVEFDPAIVEFVEPEITPEIAEIIERRAGIPGIDWQLEWFSDNEAGWTQISLVLDFGAAEGFSIPPGLLLQLASLTFRVKADAPAGQFPLEFTRPDGAAYAGHFRDGEKPVYNAARRPGRPFTPEDRFEDSIEPDLADGSVVVSIIGDVGIFVRGDSNGDDVVDISDPIATLAFLFGDGLEISCEDAVDSNDDGRIDISDPIDTLSYLFDGPSGPARYPSPDETDDSLGCER